MKWFIASWMVLIFVSTSVAQPEGNAIRVDENGTDVFRQLLADAGLTAIRYEAISEYDPHDILFVLLGSGSDSLVNVPMLRQLIQSGGSLLIASDRRLQYPSELLGFRIRDDRIFVENVERDAYVGNQQFPYVVPKKFSDILSPTGPNSIFDALQVMRGRVASNAPSSLEIIERNGMWRALAHYPESARSLRTKQFLDPARDLFAIAGTTSEEGKALVLADHSVFINSVLLRDDIQNVEFARLAIQWLQRRQRGPGPTKVLFVYEGRVQTRLELPLPEPPLPPINELVNAVLKRGNEFIVERESEDAFNSALLNRVGENQIFRTILFLLTGFCFIWLLRKTILNRFKPETPMMKPRITKDFAAASNLFLIRTNQRIAFLSNEDLLRNDIHSFFLQRLQPELPPEIHLKGFSLSNLSIRRNLRKLWNALNSPSTLTKHQTKRLKKLLARVTRSRLANRWDFVDALPQERIS